MGKLSKSAKLKKLNLLNQHKPATEEFMDTEFNLLITVQTLERFVEQPELLQGSEMKKMRQLLYSLKGGNKTIHGKVADALKEERWWDALGHLTEMQYRGILPKLGSVQRWTRDCDASANTSTDGKTTSLVFKVLDAIIRTADPAMIGIASKSPVLSTNGSIRYHQEFVTSKDDDRLNDKLLIQVDEKYKEKFRVVHHEKGLDRAPANLHDMILYTNIPGTIPLNPPAEPVKRVDIETLPGVFILQNVLSAKECCDIVSAAETMEFIPDEPTGGSGKEKSSVLAHNFFWLADPELNERIYDRVKALLPQAIGEGGNVAGLNARWRVYRYRPGSIYRPHIDGAWPGSLLDSDGEYHYDAFGDRWSRLTFLIRLNDSFKGGATTYLTPSEDVGFLDATPVCPSMGECVVFPHGETAGSILHEGSPVIDSGSELLDTKYVIRTEVLYKIPGHNQKLELK